MLLPEHPCSSVQPSSASSLLFSRVLCVHLNLGQYRWPIDITRKHN
jgi:hypothetical protein